MHSHHEGNVGWMLKKKNWKIKSKKYIKLIISLAQKCNKGFNQCIKL